MKTYVAFLRGINVSGQKKVPMAALRDVLTQSGFQNVQTYIQSGNVVFQSLETNKITLENTIKKIIFEGFGFEVVILIKTEAALKKIIDQNPFSDEKIEQTYYTLLNESPDFGLIKAIREISHQNESFVITNDCVYFYSSVGYGKAKGNNNFFERKLKVPATTRNYKTMVKLLSLCQE